MYKRGNIGRIRAVVVADSQAGLNQKLNVTAIDSHNTDKCK